MPYATEHIADRLKAARESKGLSQRELSRQAGVPQGHISKIENGTVDLRLSSLIALARVLDLELALVPRRTMPAVQSIVRSSEPASGHGGEEARLALRALNRLQETIAGLSSPDMPGEIAQLQRQLRDLQRFQGMLRDARTIEDANKALQAFKRTGDQGALHRALSRLKDLRGRLAHGPESVPTPSAVPPAYSLDEDEDG